jgi:hypothetical protein
MVKSGLPGECDAKRQFVLICAGAIVT